MLRRTSAVTLLIAGGLGLVLGRSMRPVIEGRGGIAPTIGWTATIGLVLGSCVLLALAAQTYRLLNHDRRILHNDRAVKLLALAKAGAVAGALVAGLYAGYALAFADATASDLGRERVIRSGFAALAGLSVMVSGLILEWTCRIPGDDDPTDAGEADPA